MEDVNLLSINDKTIDDAIKYQLECLNSTSEKINDLENELNVKRDHYRAVLQESSVALNILANKLGDCVPNSRPYYEVKRLSKELQNATQQATLKYDKAVNMHAAAREMVTVAERGMHLNASNTVWIDMLNRANERVIEAEREKFKCKVEHERQTMECKLSEEKVKKLKKTLKSSIKKSLPYFEMKKENQDKLEKVSLSVSETASRLHKSKMCYSKALRNLESISNTIHERRESTAYQANLFLLGQRQEGVGAEDSPSVSESAPFRQSEFSLGPDYKSIVEDLGRVDSVDHFDGFNFTSSESVSLDSVSVYSVKSRFSVNTVGKNSIASNVLKELPGFVDGNTGNTRVDNSPHVKIFTNKNNEKPQEFDSTATDNIQEKDNIVGNSSIDPNNTAQTSKDESCSSKGFLFSSMAKGSPKANY